MTFTSLQFFGFIPILIAFYFIIPQKYRWLVLLLSSYYFYITWKFSFLIFLIIETVISYILAILINKSKNKGFRKTVLILSVVLFTGILFAFKYLEFFISNINYFFNITNITISLPIIKLLIPIGLSFYTFLILGYIIDVYNEKIKPEFHFGNYAVFVAFFPKLISGPIERGSNFLPQLKRTNEIDYNNIRNGIKLIIWGLFKKVMIADRLVFSVNKVFDNPNNSEGISILISIIFLSIQIYADFSGYTDMAIGVTRILGIKLTDNFNRPYISKSISEFWQRWHITLSNWLRDYVFLPIAYSVSRKIMKSKLKVKPENYSYILGISVTMLICGIWHGAKWTFIFWGIMHGLYMAIGFITKKTRKRFYKKVGLNKNIQEYFSIIFTFILISFSWIIFRANSLPDTIILIKNIFAFNSSHSVLNLFKNPADIYVSIISIIFLFVVEFIQTYYEKRKIGFAIDNILRLPLVILILISIFIFGKFEQFDFLYFNF